jgi:peptidoglycan/LPS O-acetylase OafA/YrhL
MRVVTGAVLDVCCVAAFVMIGRASHDEAGSATGFATTAWPFLAGAVVGWAVTRAWRRPAALVPTGLGVWLATIAVGMALRALSGQSIAASFVSVTLVFLGVVMLGWRAVASAVIRWRTPVSGRLER